MTTGQRVTFQGWTGDEDPDATATETTVEILPRPDYLPRGWYAVRLPSGRELWASGRELV